MKILTKTCLILMMVASIITSSFSQSQWIPANTGTNEELITIAVSDDGFILCGGTNGIILKSTDNGETWASTTIGNEWISHVDTYDNICVATSANGHIYRSIDSGETWQHIVFFDLVIRGLYIISPDRIYICGRYEMAFESNDGGNIWTQIPYILGAYWLRDITFPDERNGYIVGDGGRAYKTPNYGYGWFLMNTRVSTNLTSVSFPVADTGYIAGLDGTLLKTTDGGIHWGSSYSGTTDFRNVYFITPMEGFVSAENGIILHTTDGGNLWEQQETFTTVILKEFCYLPEINRLIVCGENGTILYNDLATGLKKPLNNIKPGAEVQIFPNPAEETITFRINGLQGNSGNLSIFSSNMKDVHEIRNVGNGEHQINLSSFPGGIYFYQLTDQNQSVISGRFIKK